MGKPRHSHDSKIKRPEKINYPNHPESLRVYEWAALALIAGALILFIIITNFIPVRDFGKKGVPHEVYNNDLVVFVEGCAEVTGRLCFKKGARIDEVLAVAKPTAEADLRGIKRYARVRDGQIVEIPKIEWIEITLKGAVEESRVIKVPRGARVIDLLDIVDLHPDADREWLQKKRKLKDLETVTIPVRGQKINANLGKTKKAKTSLDANESTKREFL